MSAQASESVSVRGSESVSVGVGVGRGVGGPRGPPRVLLVVDGPGGAERLRASR